MKRPVQLRELNSDAPGRIDRKRGRSNTHTSILDMSWEQVSWKSSVKASSSNPDGGI